MLHPRNQRLQACFEELAKYLRETQTRSAVLHGIDPISGSIGRDLDLYVPEASAARVALAFADILRNHGFKWVTLVDPIWGHRCVGVAWPDYVYCELHIISSLSFGLINYDKFEFNGYEKAYGLTYDPALWFTKGCFMRNNSKVLNQQPLWNGNGPDRFSLEHQAEIERQYEAHWKRGGEFVRLILGQDTDLNFIARRRMLLSIMARSCTGSPFLAAESAQKWLKRKISRYFSPCTPVVCLITTRACEQIADDLKARLGFIFPAIRVSTRNLPALSRRFMQARQCLVVHCSRDFHHRCNASLTLNEEARSDGELDVDMICKAILDGFVHFNKKWEANYRLLAERS